MRRAFGNLDADGLLAGDRREDADVGRGERVGEVVLELGDLADLRARRELQLVAAHVRTGDRADQLRLDLEVAEHLEQGPGGLLHVAAVGAAVLVVVAAPQQLRRRHPVVDLLGLGDPAALGAHRRPRDLDLAAVGSGELGRRGLGGSVVLEGVLGLVQLVRARLSPGLLVALDLGFVAVAEVDLARVERRLEGLACSVSAVVRGRSSRRSASWPAPSFAPRRSRAYSPVASRARPAASAPEPSRLTSGRPLSSRIPLRTSSRAMMWAPTRWKSVVEAQ